MGLVKEALQHGGKLFPLLPPSQAPWKIATNPSVLVHEGEITVLVRTINYALYHSTSEQHNHHYGPLQYIHPENDQHLRTENYIMRIDRKNGSAAKVRHLDTSSDRDARAEFIGLEDARLVHWDNQLYACGVGRDSEPTGIGRMELWSADGKTRFRIPTPPGKDSFCEKNWMPILDQPNHFVKWCNPTEVVRIDPISNTCETVILDETKVQDRPDLRGGSQVIPWQGGYLAVVHETHLYRSQLDAKNACYRHRFIMWDKDFKSFTTSDAFTFLDGQIEFCCGMAQDGDDLLLTFGYQDSSAYMLRLPVTMVENKL